MELRTKRAYEAANTDDGFRVLVDRLWPRGVSKERAAIDLWAKEISPSNELRREFHGADPITWASFEDRYRAELADNPEYAAFRTEIAQHPRVTFVYAAHDVEHNNAVVLAKIVRDESGG